MRKHYLILILTLFTGSVHSSAGEAAEGPVGEFKRIPTYDKWLAEWCSIDVDRLLQVPKSKADVKSIIASVRIQRDILDPIIIHFGDGEEWDGIRAYHNSLMIRSREIEDQLPLLEGFGFFKEE